MGDFLPLIIEQAADRRPDAEAFRFDGTALSYAELSARSNQLAQRLVDDGVGPGDLVGILMGKSLLNPVAVFGIQKAGAAYVPLDPAAPVARLEAIAGECKLRHLVTEPDRAAKVTKLARAASTISHVYGLDSIDADAVATRTWSDVEQAPTVDPGIRGRGDDVAYIIFTSGSTGVPKGIAHTHSSGSAYARMGAELYDLRPDDRLSNFPPLHFDQSTFDFFSGPLAGATTVIIGGEHQLVPASLSALIEQERLTVWYSVPLALIQLLNYGVLDQRDCSSLRWVIYGGEPFPLKHLKALMDRWPQARFSNCYGPAETNQCTYHHLAPLTDEAVAADRSVPIGHACPGMQTAVVDSTGTPLPAGEIGELIVHSPTTMQGYWGRPELDRAAFWHQPGPDGDATRWYRTGDLARIDEAGLLDFMGRRDRQVKVRGVRVELDDVEAAVSTHTAVDEVAVTAEADDDGVVICAWVRLSAPEATTADVIRRHAAARLGRAALPDHITVVNDFARTTSGKIDYGALRLRGESA
ncbi:MAG: amino acid adenylation domain-containing protein [Actinomycetota bacterium]